MALYPRRSADRVRQVTADLLILGWIAVWAWLAWRAWRAVTAVAEPARRTAAAATDMRQDFANAGKSAGNVPLAGGDLRRPFDLAAGSLDQIIAAAHDQVRTIENLALVSGWLVFLVPVLIVLVRWLPDRLRFVQHSTAVERLMDSGADLDLFALRAMATRPMHELGRISPDPVGEWRAGHWPVIVALADLELRSAGLVVPPALRGAPPSRRPAMVADLTAGQDTEPPNEADLHTVLRPSSGEREQ